MKDILITKKRQKTELKVWLLCLAAAFGLNIYAIATYEGQWSELFWSLGFVTVTSFVIYGLIGLIRLICYGTDRLLSKITKSDKKQ